MKPPTEMTDEELRVAVAERVGWKAPFQKEWLRGEGYEGEDIWAFCGTDPEGERSSLPSYPHSLDSCAEFERTLKGNAHPSAQTELESKYRDALAKVLGVAWYQSARLIFATARQRCIAFLSIK